MATKIEWTDETWNPLLGCEHVSPGCDNCYAAREASGRLKNHPLYAGLAVAGKFTGDVRLVPERLTQPLRWAKPRRVFVNSMSDLFHADVPADFIAQVFAVMALTPRHTYQVLTKRHGRLRSLLSSEHFPELVDLAIRDLMMAGRITERDAADAPRLQEAPLPNVWLGVSVEDQQRADLRIPHLLETPAAVRFLSCEPLLGPVTLRDYLLDHVCDTCTAEHRDGRGIQWVIVGGESGHGARPMHPAWARTLRDECVAAGVAFHFKQWGVWAPVAPTGAEWLAADWHLRSKHPHVVLHESGEQEDQGCFDYTLPTGWQRLVRMDKHVAGRQLDGRTWDDYPTALVPS